MGIIACVVSINNQIKGHMSDTMTMREKLDHESALREYEAAHKVWMNTSVFTEAGREAKRALGDARDKLNLAEQNMAR